MLDPDIVLFDEPDSGLGRTATLAFGIRLMDLDEQKRVIDAMRDRLDEVAPPACARNSPGCRCWPPTPTPRSPRAYVAC